MKKIFLRIKKNVQISAVFLLVSFFIVPGFALAVSPSGCFQTEPLKTPAYIQSKGNLLDVDVRPHAILFQPHPPLSADVDVIELLLQLNETLILGYLENLTGFGPRLSGTEACDQAAYYLYNTFRDIGLSVRYHNYTDDVVSGSNIEATLEGTNSTNIFIICAHYDSVAAGPGADDDGSGVAAVLAAAEIMKNYEFYHTIRFVCFSGEEQGLIGSRHYAEDAYTNNDTILAVLNADMIGFAPNPSDGTQGKIFEDTASEWIVDYSIDVSDLYADYIGIDLNPQGESWGSDHYSFWQYGYNAVFYHEYNFNDYYHSAEDIIEHMNLTYSAHFSRLILATLAELAQEPRPMLKIISITGGFGVTSQVSNIGDLNANDIEINLLITGGLLGFLNASSLHQTPLLPPDDSIEVTRRLFRIGKIDITVTASASNADQVTKHASGFLLGPFVLRIESEP
jgi:hypothetical protein